MLREERKRTENETLRNHTVQIEQLEAKARFEYAEMLEEQGMKQEREINKLKETMRLENEEQERQWERKQKEHEFDIDQRKEREQGWSTRRWKNSGKIMNN